MLKISSTLLLAIGLLLNGFAAYGQIPDPARTPDDRIPARNPVTPPQPPANLSTKTITSGEFEGDILIALLGTRLQVSTSGAGDRLIGWVEVTQTPQQKWEQMRKELLLGCAEDPNPEECIASVRAAMKKLEQRIPVGYYSFIKWGPTINLLKPDLKNKILDVPVIHIGNLTYLINNLHAVVKFRPDFSATVGDGGLNFSIVINSDYPTIECVGSRLCPGNINLNGANLSIKLKNLSVTPEGKLTYNSAVVSFTGDISFSGILSLADGIANLESDLKSMIESMIREQLFTKDVKDAFAKAMGLLVRRRISGDNNLAFPVSFYSVGVEGSDLIIKYTTPHRKRRSR